MKKNLATLLVGITILTAMPVKAKELNTLPSIAYNSTPEIAVTDLDIDIVDFEFVDNIAQRRLTPKQKRRIRRKIIRGIRRHRRRKIRRRIIRAIRRHRRRQIIRGIIGNRICADRGGYWEDNRCYYDYD